MSRQEQAFEIRVNAAKLATESPPAEQDPLRDTSRNMVGSYTKGLPHVKDTGIMEDPQHYALFVRAINTGSRRDIRNVPLGPNVPKGEERFNSGISKGNGKNTGFADVRAWESMAAGNAFDLEGPDPQSLAMPRHPALDSAELISEMTEIYSMALTRDVPFIHFKDHKAITQAVADMNATEWISNPPTNLSEAEKARLRGPFDNSTVFRGVLEGDDEGPYISQFLLAGNTAIGCEESTKEEGFCQAQGSRASGFITYGAQRIDQRVRVVEPKKDYMTTWESWLDVQNGADLRGRETYLPGYRFMATPRDLATYVHYDALYQAYLNACIILLSLGVRYDRGIPFQRDDDRDHQQGFALWGGPHILTLVTEVATRALKAVRYQKFNVHRRPRPEALAGLIERHRHEPESDLYLEGSALFNGLDKNLLTRIEEHNRKQNKTISDFGNPRTEDFDPRGQTDGNILLPMAFPEGSPMHPSYGAGHATVAGACVTILKAWFDTDEKLPFAFEASEDGTHLKTWDGPALTVGNELNKVCSNICIGRNWAGVHYFTDYFESLKIGEEIAIGILQEQALTYQEKFSMSFTKFDKTPCKITNRN